MSRTLRFFQSFCSWPRPGHRDPFLSTRFVPPLPPPWTFLGAVLLALAVLVGAGCAQPSEQVIRGTTMGTVYTVRAAHASASALAGLEQEIRSRLEEINAAMSVYRSKSEISRFNTLAAGGAMAVSEDFDRVVRVCLEVHAVTGGAFDPTVKPLLDLWGFGSGSIHSGTWRPPFEESVHHAMTAVGMDLVDASVPGRLGKRHPNVQMDLGAVAKGYAVDALAELLERRGIDDYLVDIGGDLRVSGRNQEGQRWRIGVNQPLRKQAWDDVLLVLRPADKAVLTSGDYRQFFEHEGRYFSHVLDPRTGFPPENDMASVTVIADSATFADALATGLMVLGLKYGLALVETLPGVEALFLVRTIDGGLRDSRSSGFDRAAGLEAAGPPHSASGQGELVRAGA